MANVVQFPGTRDFSRGHVGAAFLADPPQHTHAVQFYEKEEFLFDTVSGFLGAGLVAGEQLLVIATKAHVDGFERRLEAAGLGEMSRSDRITVLDADQTLSKFMVLDMPDPDLFRDLLGHVIGEMAARKPKARIRAFGEMVDLLWRRGNSRGAIALEELWNEAGKEHSFSLLCAYVMGNFYSESESVRFMEVCRNHSHVIPTEAFAELEDPHARLREISLLQQRARSLENEIQHRKELEGALRDALRERGRAELELRACVKREQEARAHAEASDAFKEMFFGILGHDLRNPLNTILATAQMMTVRKELPDESHRRVERILSSGQRMQRMIEQILDVTRVRLGGGIQLTVGPERDLVELVTKLVDEIRVANPSRAIELVAPEQCRAPVDPDRFEQVVSNLVGNALTHGAPDEPVTVTLEERPRVVTFRVANAGPPIAPALLPVLFEPFKQTAKPATRPEGLGLGLYITERIVVAHGGTIEVESTNEKGTRFEVSIPRHP